MRIAHHLRAAAAAMMIASGAAALAAEPVTLSVQDFGPNRFELVASGTELSSRDAVEGRLLLSAARQALGTGHKQFALLAMPGEQTGVAPHRPTPAYGAKYSNWHAEWYYRIAGERWRTWRPQSGAPFWADQLDMTRVSAFEAHAIIEVGPEFTTESTDIFDAEAVITDLGPLVPSN